MTAMHVVTTETGIGRVENDEIALLDSPFSDLGALLRETGSLEVLDAAPVVGRVQVGSTRLLAPLGVPRAIWGIGLNYRSKAERTGRSLPTEPILFLATPAAVLAPGGSVALPAAATRELDYEAEIAVVIGRTLYCAEADEVWPSIAGITAANDMTARDVMRSTANPTLAKSFAGFKPLGASVCTLAELPDRDSIRVRSWVNGELQQDDTSAGLIFSIPELIARISRYAPLRPGDVVLTGTPAGTGQDRNCFLTPGDDIRIEVGPVLPLLTSVVPATA